MKTKVSEKLSAILSDGIDVHRCAAARGLGVLKTPEATEKLVAALLDEDPDVRVDAATALAAINDPATAAKLMDNLIGDPESDVKKAAISALVAMRHAPVVPLLKALVTSRAADQIAWDEDEFFASGWDNWDDIQIAAIKGLAEFGAHEAVPDILDALSDEEGQDVSEPAYLALANMGPGGAAALATIYETGSARDHRRIARAVGQSDNPDLDDLRQKLLTHTSEDLRALGLQNFASDDPNLAALFADDSAKVRVAVVRHAGADNLELLTELINDPSADVRVEVFKVIAANPESFREKDQIDAVKSTLKGDPMAAKYAALALFALKGPKVAKGFTHVLGNADIPRDFRIGVLETLEKGGQIAVPALLDVAGDDDRQLRLASMTTLAGIAASDPDWPNDAGTGLLAALRGELVTAPEEEEVAPEPEVEPEPAPEPDAAELEEIIEEIEESLPLVADDVPEGSTLHAIMVNKPADVEAPEEIVLDETQQRLLDQTNTRKFAKRKVSWATAVAPHQDVQRFSARLLGQIVQPDVTGALIETLDADIDDETREGVLFSLAAHGEETGGLPESLFDKVTALTDHEKSEIRMLATRILAWIKSGDADEALIGLLSHEDPLVRVEAVQALGRRPGQGDRLRAALNDPYLGVAISAARALARAEGDGAVDDLVEFATRNDGTYRFDIGQLLAAYAPVTGAARLLDLLNDETRKAQWLVAIDALAELFKHDEPADDTRLVA